MRSSFFVYWTRPRSTCRANKLLAFATWNRGVKSSSIPMRRERPIAGASQNISNSCNKLAQLGIHLATMLTDQRLENALFELLTMQTRWAQSTQFAEAKRSA